MSIQPRVVVQLTGFEYQIFIPEPSIRHFFILYEKHFLSNWPFSHKAQSASLLFKSVLSLRLSTVDDLPPRELIILKKTKENFVVTN